MLYLLTFTEAAIVCDFTIILETIPSMIFEKRHICQCGSYPFTDCWGLKHENRFKPFTAFWISKFSFHFILACIIPALRLAHPDFQTFRYPWLLTNLAQKTQCFTEDPYDLHFQLGDWKYFFVVGIKTHLCSGQTLQDEDRVSGQHSRENLNKQHFSVYIWVAMIFLLIAY